MPVDPVPGPRPVEEIIGGRRLGAHAVLAGPETTTPDGVPFSESLMAGHLGGETVLIDVTGGAPGVAAGIDSACAELGCDLVICADVGGDMLAVGTEPGLASPLCDALMAAGSCACAARPLLAVIGAGCDGELTQAEVLGRVAAAGRAGAWIGTWSPPPEVVAELEEAGRNSHTEASLQIARCARGEIGPTPIRAGRRHVELGPLGALAFFFDPAGALGEVAPLAPLVAEAETHDEARSRLAAQGVRSELDWERDRAGSGPRTIGTEGPGGP